MDAVKRRLVLVVVLACALTSVGLSLRSSHEARDTQNRLCAYAQENARVSKIRSAATVKRDAAQDAFLAGAAQLGSRGSSPFTKLSRTYLQAAAEVAAERASNPLPDPPQDCKN